MCFIVESRVFAGNWTAVYMASSVFCVIAGDWTAVYMSSISGSRNTISMAGRARPADKTNSGSVVV